MLTRITDWKIPYVYQIKTIEDMHGLCNSLCHADNRTYFQGLSIAKLKGSAHVFLGEGSGKI